jgi:hypothetical protein
LLGELPEGKLHEQFLWGGAGNGRGNSAPRQSLNPATVFKALEQNLTVKTFIGTSGNARCIQIWPALIALLLLKWLHYLSKAGCSVQSWDSSENGSLLEPDEAP